MALMKVNALELRRLADALASDRGPDGKPLYLVYDAETDPSVRIVPRDKLPETPGTPVLEIDTFEVTQDRPDTTSVKIEAGGPSKELFPEFDAVFWSESSVEKFVLPYYASKSLWEAAAVLYKLTFYWYAIEPLSIPQDPEGDDPVVFPPDMVPFALAHTPDSDWDALRINPEVHRRNGAMADGPGEGVADGASGLGRNLHLLFRGRDGRIRSWSLAELPDPPQGWPIGRAAADAMTRRAR